MEFVREQFFLAAAAQNIRRLVRFLSHGPRPLLATGNLEWSSSVKKNMSNRGTCSEGKHVSRSSFFNNHAVFAN